MFQVYDVDSLCRLGSEGGEEVQDKVPLLIEAGLNKMEADGWTFIECVSQHKQWGHEDDPAKGALYGPYFVFHMAGRGTRVRLADIQAQVAAEQQPGN